MSRKAIQDLIDSATSRATAVKTASSKIAADNPAAPKEGHPSDSFDDYADVPKGSELTDAGAEHREMLGQLSASTEGSKNVPEKDPATENTDLHTGGDDKTPELNPTGSLSDPGPDSDHPASPNNTAHKYASFTDATALSRQLLTDIDTFLAEVTAEVPKLAAKPEATTVPAVADAVQSDDSDLATKIASLFTVNGQLNEQKLAAATNVLSQQYEPYVLEGIMRANRVADYLQAVSTNPKLAMDMIGAGEDPAAMGMPPGMPAGGDPAAMGMPPADPMAGGGEGDAAALQAELEAAAAEAGIPVEELIQLLIAELSGGGGDSMAGGGDPSAAPAGDPAADSAAATPADEPSAPPAEEKTAAAPKAKKLAAKKVLSSLLAEMVQSKHR